MKTNMEVKNVKNVKDVKDFTGVKDVMDEKNSEEVEEVEGGRTMTRGRALKKAGKVTLAAGVMMVLLNNPKKALAGSGPSPGGESGGLAKPPSGSDW